MFDFSPYGAATALVEGDRRVSYDELTRLSCDIAAPCPPRALVFVLCSNTLASIAGYVGFLNAGVVPLLLDRKIDDGLLGSLLASYRPSYLWVPEGEQARLAGTEAVYQQEGYVLLATGEENPAVLHGDLGLLMSTSGSTGSPKLVRQSYQNVAANTRSIVEYLHITADDRAITSLPMNYVYGLSVINTHLWAGATLILTNLNCYGKGFWTLFRDEQATSFAGVPFMYEMLDKLRFTRKDLAPSLKTMTQAGGKLAPDLQDKFARYALERGIDFVVMYGASEATARMGYLPPAHALDKRGSVGIAIPGGRFELCDEAGQTIEEPGVAGELVYWGPNVALGYALEAADLARGDEWGGRLATGDVACRDEDGYYAIVGRMKRFIKIVGRRTNLDEMERLLVRHLGTLDVACAGHDDLLAVFVVDATLADQVVDYVYQTTGINRRMIRVLTVEEIPKNTSGKTLYGQLNELLEQRGQA